MAEKPKNASSSWLSAVAGFLVREFLNSILSKSSLDSVYVGTRGEICIKWYRDRTNKVEA